MKLLHGFGCFFLDITDGGESFWVLGNCLFPVYQSYFSETHIVSGHTNSVCVGECWQCAFNVVQAFFSAYLPTDSGDEASSNCPVFSNIHASISHC